ncbi:hypothetical protein QWY86_12975 [Pedobacter aquatilis]|uniref:hypothetical protein n=1 Tax=Pedobacter aquatilis TaxID=351343 RepID=UPI0025B3C84B|nr:hypothetical protein [Pedobacter aquatilis]MDN3587588.1 hypothetical protein [Pedobacter aquatilis]
MKVSYIFFSLLMLISLNLFAQRTGVIIGTVQDRTNELLSKVTISLNDSLVSASSDSTGKFKITIPVGTYKLLSLTESVLTLEGPLSKKKTTFLASFLTH